MMKDVLQQDLIIAFRDQGQSKRMKGVSSSYGFPCTPPVQECLLQYLARPCFLYLEYFDSTTIRCSPYSPNTLAHYGGLQKVKEIACEIDTKISVPFEAACTLDVGGNPLRI